MENPTISVCGSKSKSNSRLGIRTAKIRRNRHLGHGRKHNIVKIAGKVLIKDSANDLPLSEFLDLPAGVTVAAARKMILASIERVQYVRVPQKLLRHVGFLTFLAGQPIEVIPKVDAKPFRKVGRAPRTPEPISIELDVDTTLRDPDTGRLDARKTALLFDFTLSDLATKVCGVTKQSLGKSPISAGIQQALEPMEEVAQMLQHCGGSPAKFRAWLNRRNREFAPINGSPPTPRELILLGRSAVVAHHLQNLLTGHPA